VKYRKKPVVIEAFRFDGRNRGLIVSWMLDHSVTVPDPLGEAFLIPTLEGVMRASIGDYIIKGVQGEFYPCKPDIFAATYEAVEEN